MPEENAPPPPPSPLDPEDILVVPSPQITQSELHMILQHHIDTMMGQAVETIACRTHSVCAYRRACHAQSRLETLSPDTLAAVVREIERKTPEWESTARAEMEWEEAEAAKAELEQEQAELTPMQPTSGNATADTSAAPPLATSSAATPSPHGFDW